jgi:hypothetical protein
MLAHPNIVQFFGIANLTNKKVGLVIELCDQDLDTYSERVYELRSKPKPQVSKALIVF